MRLPSQIVKMRAGAVKSLVAYYENAVLVHVKLDYLVVTCIALSDSNVGVLVSFATGLAELLRPLQSLLDTKVAADE